MTARQTYIPGTEPPARNEDIELAIERWYEARAAQKEAADTTAVRAASVLEAMADAEVDVYPFAEPETGKRKVLDASAVRRTRVKRAQTAKQEALDREFDAGSRAPSGSRLTVPPAIAALADDAVTMTVSVNGGKPVEVNPAKLTRAARNVVAKMGGEVTGSVAAGRSRKGES